MKLHCGSSDLTLKNVADAGVSPLAAMSCWRAYGIQLSSEGQPVRRDIKHGPDAGQHGPCELVSLASRGLAELRAM
jgi:hypothetical protein